jgi:type I restriction enzyme M protein
LANLPRFGVFYKATPITLAKLAPPTNLVSLLFGIANIMRSHGVNDESLRYRETVKLILARYCDEREAKLNPFGELALQVLPGTRS